MKRRRIVGRRTWSHVDLLILRACYAQVPTAELSDILRRPVRRIHARAHAMGLHKDRDLIARQAREKMADPDHPARRHWWRPGHVPATKGRPMPPHVRARVRHTWFRKGTVSPRWDPDVYCVGALRINSDGYIDMKVRPGPLSWVPLHRWVWERAHGPLRPGQVVRARDGDPHNTNLDNLYLASRRDVMLDNSIQNYPKPIVRLVQLRGALNAQIRRRERRATTGA